MKPKSKSPKHHAKKLDIKQEVECYIKYVIQTNWASLVLEGFPILNMTVKGTQDDSDLYSKIEAFAHDTEIDFADAAAWVLRAALGVNQTEQARKMAKAEIPWDQNTLFACRRMSLQLCRWLASWIDPSRVDFPLTKIDHMIWSLLITDEEILEARAPKNSLPC
jgi:hypothetical protein